MQEASYTITQIVEEQVPLAAGASPAFLIPPFWTIVVVMIVLMTVALILKRIKERHQIEILAEEDNELNNMDEQWRDYNGRTS